MPKKVQRNNHKKIKAFAPVNLTGKYYKQSNCLSFPNKLVFRQSRKFENVPERLKTSIIA
jgi:hypothetical protein